MRTSSRSGETALYPLLAAWLKDILQSRHPRSRVKVIDTSRRALSNVLHENGWTNWFDGWETFEVHVDLAGFVFLKNRCRVFLVEVKANPVTLRDLGQLLGYCRVVMPSLGLIVSPRGLSSAMSTLLQVHRRIDLLDFGGEKPVVVARWQEAKRDLDYGGIIPAGTSLA